MSLTDKVLFERLPKSLPAKKFRHSLQPTSGNSTFSPGNMMEILIPAHKYQYLNGENTCLRFKFTAKDGACRIDHNMSAVIDRFEVYLSGSNLCESVHQYSTLFSTMMDAQYEKANHKQGLSILYGTEEESTLTNIRSGNAADANPAAVNGECENAYYAGRGKSFAVDDEYYACLPLLSSLIGVTQDKYLPLHNLGTTPVRLVLYLNTAANALVKTTNDIPSYELSEVYLDCEILELSESAHMVAQQANSAFGKDIQIAGKQYTHFLYTLDANTAASTQVTKLLDARFSSVNQLLFCPRNQTGQTESYALSSRVNPYSFLQVRVGSFYSPPKRLEFHRTANGVQNNSEAFIETQKSFNALSHLQHWGSISASGYNVNDTAIVDNIASRNATYKNKFYMAIDFEAHGKPDKHFDGINTISDQVSIEGIIQAGQALQNTITVDVFVLHDAIISIDEYGIATRSM